MTRLFTACARKARHALVCMTLFCMAIFSHVGLPPVIPVISFAPLAHAQQAALDAEQEATALLREAAHRTEGIRTLYATFTQEKHLSILDAPLTSSGYLCLERVHGEGNTSGNPSANAGSNASNDRVLWAYEKPTPSGFAQEDGQSWLWAGDGASRRRAQGPEAVALKTVTTQIMAWIRIRPDALTRVYRMERVYPSQSSDNAPVLRLTPRQSGAFFSALEVTLNPTLDTVRQLRFLEKNGDSTVLTFHDTRLNAAMPAQCRPPKPLQ